ncbi:MAG: FAD-dependent oxidoreductase, partial [Pseudomonadota bacterium]
MSQSKEKQPAPARVGVYVCHCGGNISDQVDVEKVAHAAAGLTGVAVARHNSFMCSDPGQQMIMDDIASGRVDRVVVASCAPALHETTFRQALMRAGLNPYLYEHANIREQVSWVHHGPGATAKAAALVAAAVAKARELEPLEPIRVAAEGHATVIGGGMAGLTAALELAGRGVRVSLVERSPFLGGNLARLERTFPTGELAADLISGLAARVLAEPNIELITCAQVTGFSGYVGDFRLTVSQAPPSDFSELDALGRVEAYGPDCLPFVGVCPAAPPSEPRQIDLHTGAMVLATGFRHYTPPDGEYGYGLLPGVLTLPEFIRLMAAAPQGEALTYAGAPVRSIALIHCVGSRQIPGLHEPPEGRELNQHCSRVCCTAALQAAGEIKERFPETTVYELYRDIRAYGRGHEEYYVNASRAGVLFARFNPEDGPTVAEAADGESRLTVTVRDTLLSGEDL